jgi:hypothetical protein
MLAMFGCPDRAVRQTYLVHWLTVNYARYFFPLGACRWRPLPWLSRVDATPTTATAKVAAASA